MRVSTPHARYGDLGFTSTIEERFWRNVVIVPYDRGCWVWAGGTNEKGYGRLGSGKRGTSMVKAHILSWILHKGRIPSGQCVLHRCDNPSCVNPGHLWLGTRGENNKDCANKGRKPKGETHSCHKLTENDVRLIRGSYPMVSQSELARRFNVNWSAIWKIIHRVRWNHVG